MSVREDVVAAVAASPCERVCARFTSRIAYSFARRHLLIAVDDAGGSALPPRMWVAEATSRVAIANCFVRYGAVLATEVRPAAEIAARVDDAYAMLEAAALDGAATPDEATTLILGREVAPDTGAATAVDAANQDSDVLATRGKSAVVRLVDQILFDAIRAGASDVHVHPIADRVLIRVRLDGVLRTVREVSRGVATALVSRVKVMARLDVAECRAPQDGRASVTLGVDASASTRVDLRISTVPSVHGERVVVRLLNSDSAGSTLAFERLGMPPMVHAAFTREADRPDGILLVTGPTGSGKTTTLYTTLAWLARGGSGGSGGSGGGGIGPASRNESNIMTIEDPVEFDLARAGLAISQMHVDTRRGVTFATGLRHILRQDPDIIMVGEIRDEETARIAVQASLTGHLVLSTVHTNDAVGAVARLIDLGAEPFLVATSLSAVLAQRLVRRTHVACGGRGCGVCLGTGFLGRAAVFELLVTDETLRERISKGASTPSLREAALAAGLVPLARAAEELVARGVTSAVEVARVIHDPT
jgi:general secretion pathway protein E